MARDTDIDNKVLYAATNRSPVRGFQPPPPAAFTIIVTAARAHKSLYDPSLKTDFMRKWMACRSRPQPAIPRNRLGPRPPIFSHFLSLPVFQLLFRRFRIVKSISEQDDDAVYLKKTACCDTNENNNYHRRIIIIIVLFVLSSVDDHLSILFYFYLWILKKSEDPLETFYEMDIILVIL